MCLTAIWFSFASAAIETGVSISTLGFTLAGADIDNYSLTQPVLSADITSPLGIEESALKGLVRIYPNPVTDQFTIESKENIEQLALFNLLGQKIKSLKPQNKLITMEVSDLKLGVYVVSFTINAKIYTQKIVKN